YVEQINSLEQEMSGFSEEQVKQKTKEWKSNPQDLDELLPQAYALVREVAKRTLNMRHFDVQLMAGIALHQGKIAEQKTGEGKTLTATLPLYLNCLAGNGVHLVTPNDYLSRHGAGWMGPIYNYLGVSVGVVMEDRSFVFDPAYETREVQDDYATHLREVSKAEAYKCDITYGTNHTFGFDYLRDNMARDLTDISQFNQNGQWGTHNFAIVDEVDMILIDIARTPLIISAPAQTPSHRYQEASGIIKALIKDTDYDVDEKFRTATLSDLGVRKVEKMLGNSNLYEQDFEMVHLIEQALIANALYEKDRDYVVKDGKVVVVDQFTGRILPNNRYAQGLHQAIEAKEGVTVQQESVTMAEISYQNYFRMYKKLAGMTGTAETEAEEFHKIYNLEVVVIPTNKPTGRTDFNDAVYKTEAAKFKAAADEIQQRHEKGQPVLIGTTSVEKSQMLHELLARRGVTHEILNAKNHEKEALIIAQAGRKGAVTVSTNMAGRGVDIILGGDPPNVAEQEEVRNIGGLHVIGTERHESRRIDNQLRGRSGRQGDLGSSRFYLSLQDDLLRIFGGQQVESLMTRFNLDESVPLEAGIVSHAIENAQKKVESFNFDRRKHTVEMDDVMNVHRQVIYKLRRRILELGSDYAANEAWLLARLSEHSSQDIAGAWNVHKDAVGEQVWGGVVWNISWPVINLLWMEHLVDMDRIREGIGLHGYAQRDPMVEYKRQGHERFEVLIAKIYSNIAERIVKIENISVAERHTPVGSQGKMSYQSGVFESGVGEESREYNGSKSHVEPVRSNEPKIGRNDPCPCGSGKKFKRCHGR
ncbi:MAG: Protein translocase subunit SecA, partial [candidate division WWE3 bacterium GW2011_GWA2_46_9]